MDVFQVQIAQLISQRVNGTPAYYAKMAEYFQYDPDTGNMDEMVYDDSTYQAKFVKLDEGHRIIAKAAYQDYSDGNGLTLKVCKNNPDATSSSEGGVYTNLTANELTAFKNYIDEIKFVGAKIYCSSMPGDILSINATVIYDDLYIDEEQALDNVKQALIQYVKNLDFNGYIYYQSVIDAIQGADHIISVSGPTGGTYAKVTHTEYNMTEGKYSDTPIDITDRKAPRSGYLTFVNDTVSGSPSTLVADADHFIFVKNSNVTA